MPVPDDTDPRAAYVQIAEDLRAQIAAGELEPPARLPSQRELAEKYGVAQETLRRATDVLAREGLLSTRTTRGTFVLKKPGEPEPSPEFQALAGEIHRLAERVEALERSAHHDAPA